MWWLIVTCSYLAIGTTVFKFLYRRYRGDHLATVELARLEALRTREMAAKYPRVESDHPCYFEYRRYQDEHLTAENRLRRLQRLENTDTSFCSFAGALWPLTLLVVLAVGVWKLISATLFRSGLDKGAEVRAAKIVAHKTAMLEQERAREELIALGKKALEEEQ